MSRKPTPFSGVAGKLVENDCVYSPDFRFIEKINLENDAPDIQYSVTSLDVELSPSSNIWADKGGYFTNFGPEIEIIGKIDDLVEQGMDFIRIMYAYRSVSQAIPEISIETPPDATPEEERDIAAKKGEINRKVLDILRPEMVKMRELLSFVQQAINAFHACLLYVTTKDVQKDVIPDGIYSALIKLLDILLTLDNLKDMKTSLLKDFARYKRVMGSKPNVDAMEELSQLQQFISSPEPRKSRNYIFVSLRDQVKRITGHEAVLIDAMEFAMELIENVFFLAPNEKFRLTRVLPYFLNLIDGDADEPKSFNVFKSSKVKVAALQKLFKKYPVVPLYGDMTVTLEIILQKCPHFDKSGGMGLAWGHEPSQKTIEQYMLSTHWEQIRSSHAAYIILLQAALNALKRQPLEKALTEENISTAENIYSLICDGFQKVAKWSSLVQQSLAWLYTHPCSFKFLEQLGIDKSMDGAEYGRVLKYNLTKQDLSVFADVVAIIKSTSAALAKAESVCAPYIRFHTHHRIQQLVQGDLTPLLHRLDKRNRPILGALLKLRSLAADWTGGKQPKNDYKEYTRKLGNIFAVHPPRVVSAAPTQLFILRTEVGALCDTSSEVRQKSGMFGKSDLEKEDVELFRKFYGDAFYFPYLLSYSSTLREISDLGSLWYREFFLEMTKCIQFPIELSFPWILTEHLLSRQISDSNPPMMTNIMLVLDIYNDAAHNALHTLRQQFMYDEVEAETNLVVDQLYFILSDEVYTHFKSLAAGAIVDKACAINMEHLTGLEYLVKDRHMEPLLAQSALQILGRSINLRFILCQNINNKFYRDIDFAIKRFECGDASGVPELKTLLDILRVAHSRLAEHLALDSFDAVLHEVNESVAPGGYRGRIQAHLEHSLINDVFPNFIYNTHTRRFVAAPIAIRPVEYSKAPKQSSVVQAFGSKHARIFELCGKVTRNFFGGVHIDTLLHIGSGLIDMTSLIDHIVKNIFELLSDIAEYLAALKAGIPPCKLPQYMFQTVGAYGFFEGKLKAILTYDDLKPEVFQNFREVGNALLFLRDLSDAIVVSDQFDFQLLAPFLGLTPSSTASDVTGGSATAGGGGGGGGFASSAVEPSSTYLAVISHTFKTIQASDQLQNAVLRSAPSAARLPGIATRLSANFSDAVACVEPAASAVGAMMKNTSAAVASANSNNSDKSMFKWVLSQIEEYLYQQNLTVDWAASASDDGAGHANYAIEVENAKGFHRLWSALNFLFCIVESDEAIGASSEEEQAETSSLLTNQAEFGHGFVFAGCTLIHLLDQREHYELLDFSKYVLNVNAHELATEQLSMANEAGAGLLNNGGVSAMAYGGGAPIPGARAASMSILPMSNKRSSQSGASSSLGGGGGGSSSGGRAASTNMGPSGHSGGGHSSSSTGGVVVESLQRDTVNFVQAAESNLKVQKEMLDFLAAQHTPRDSYKQLSTNKTMFHPADNE